MIWLWMSAATMALTALVHCVVGEKRLIAPMLAIDHPLPKRFLARRLIRFAWHLTGALMVVCAAVMVWPGTPYGLLATTAATWLVVGIIDAVMTKIKHIGWPFLAAAGIFGLIGAAG